MVSQQVDNAQLVTEVTAAARTGRKTRDVPAASPFFLRSFPHAVSLPGSTATPDGGLARPPDLSFETLAQMAAAPAIKIALNAIYSIVIGQFTRATAKSDDSARAAFVQQTLVDSRVLIRAVTTGMRALQNGCAIHELVWRAEDLDITYSDTDPDTGEQFDATAFSGPGLVLHEAREVNPATVTQFNREDGSRTSDGRYAGFTQRAPGQSDPILVGAAESWVYTHDAEYGNLWGKPQIRDAWPFWRASQPGLTQWAYWVERKADPPLVIGFPEGSYTSEDGTVTDHATIAVETGNYVRNSTSVALPSDTYPDTNTKRWSIDTVPSTDKGAIYEQWLTFCDRQCTRSVLVPERVVFEASASAGGTNAESETHTNTFMLTLDRILASMAASATEYLAERVAVVNLGPGAPVTLEVPALANAERALLGKVLDALLSIPDGQTRLDAKAILDFFGVPNKEPDPQDQGLGFGLGADVGAGLGPEWGLPADRSGAGEPADAASDGPPDNLVLSEADLALALEDLIALAAEVDLSRYRIVPDAKSTLGVAVYDRASGKRLTGTVAAKIAGAAKTAGRRGAQRAEVEARKAQRAADAAARKTQREATAAQKKSEREAAKTQREATAAQKKQDREAKAAERKADAEAKKLSADQRTAARAERAALEKQTAGLDADLATQALKRKGWDAPGDTQPDHDAAVAEAEQTATDNPDLIVSVVKTKGGYMVITKPKDQIRGKAARPGNTALEDEDRPDDDAPGYDSARVTEEAEALIASARKRIAAVLAAGG